MRRRTFIMLLGGVVTVWPIEMRAQQTGLKRVAVVIPASADDQEWQPRLRAFVEALSQSGWSDGRSSISDGLAEISRIIRLWRES